MEALISHGTWELIEPPLGCKVGGCKSVFVVKHNPDSSMVHCKALLVAKGFT